MPRSKRTRLTHSPEFERVYRQGAACKGRLFSVHAFLNEFGTPRLGLSVSRRVGSAVTRNAVRRRLREVFHSALAEMPGSWDVVVSARPEAAEAGLDEMKEEFDRALRKLGEGGKLRDAGPG